MLALQHCVDKQNMIRNLVCLLSDLIYVTLCFTSVEVALTGGIRPSLTGLVLLHKLWRTATARVALAVLLNIALPIAWMLALLTACRSSSSYCSGAHHLNELSTANTAEMGTSGSAKHLGVFMLG